MASYYKCGPFIFRRRFAWMPVSIRHHNTETGWLENKPVRHMWLSYVMEMKTMWEGWLAFDSCNPVSEWLDKQLLRISAKEAQRG